MGFFRNPEIRREMVLWGAGLAVCLFAAKLFSGSRGMVVCLFAGFLFTAAHFCLSPRVSRLTKRVSHDILKVTYKELRDACKSTAQLA